MPSTTRRTGKKCSECGHQITEKHMLVRDQDGQAYIDEKTQLCSHGCERYGATINS